MMLDLDRTTRERKLGPTFARGVGRSRDQARTRRQHCARARRRAGRTGGNPAAGLRRKDRAKRAAVIARNNVAVEVKDLRKGITARSACSTASMTVRVGEVLALLAPAARQEQAASLHQPLEDWDSGTLRVGGRGSAFTTTASG